MPGEKTEAPRVHSSCHVTSKTSLPRTPDERGEIQNFQNAAVSHWGKANVIYYFVKSKTNMRTTTQNEHKQEKGHHKISF